jgi:hypothetical protein
LLNGLADSAKPAGKGEATLQESSLEIRTSGLAASSETVLPTAFEEGTGKELLSNGRVPESFCDDHTQGYQK